MNGTKYRAKLTLKGTASYYLLLPAEARSFLGLGDEHGVEVRFIQTDGEPPAMILTRASDQ